MVTTQSRLIKVDDAAFDRAWASRGILSPAELNRAEGFRRESNRREFFVAHVELRHMLSRRTGVAAHSLRFVNSPCPECGRETARPTLADLHRPYFSISHTSGLVAIAVSGAPVGIDVERKFPQGQGSSGIITQLHPREQREIREVSDSTRGAAVLDCWVRKEAVLKGAGVGIAHGLAEPYVGHRFEVDLAAIGWRIAKLDTPAGYAGAIATWTRAGSLNPSAQPLPIGTEDHARVLTWGP